MSREAMAEMVQCWPRCIAGITFFSPMLAVESTPQRSFSLMAEHDSAAAAERSVRKESAGARLCFRRKEETGIVVDNHAVAVAAAIDKQLAQCGVVEDVVRDDAILKASVDNAITGAPETFVSVVASAFENIADTGDAAASVQQDLCGVLGIRGGEFATSLYEIAGDADLRAWTFVPGFAVRLRAQREADRAGAVEEIAGDLITIAAHDDHVLFVVPLNAVGCKRDGGVFVARGKSGATVAGEPVVEDKAVPSAQAEAVSAIGHRFAVTHAEAPGMGEADAVATEVGDLATFDAKAVLVRTVGGALGEDAV